ncbi:hypothetical protein VTK73DRAFT_7393 [Phialemonium thermophilum]|uniref:Nucleolar protein 16 n=1 Tax=Phialemonium thermophilum TaxID=223376 RepID=A0ABR3XTZ1_9PEZI
MGRELQKKKRRSSRPKVRPPNNRKKPLNPTGNSIIAKNWNKKETLSQNYRRLGLVAKLGRPTGGVEPDLKGLDKKSGSPAVSAENPFAVKPAAQSAVREVRVERDASGRIVRILDPARDNPLNDPLRQFDSDSDSDDEPRDRSDGEEWGGIDDNKEDQQSRPGVVRELERQASRPVEKSQRHPSRGEIEWLQRLVDRYGDDTAAMARDMKLNPMQQTQADIARRLRKAKLISAKA